jgi:hypothetical protein
MFISKKKHKLELEFVVHQRNLLIKFIRSTLPNSFSTAARSIAVVNGPHTLVMGLRKKDVDDINEQYCAVSGEIKIDQLTWWHEYQNKEQVK